jgi:hypothetical protein
MYLVKRGWFDDTEIDDTEIVRRGKQKRDEGQRGVVVELNLPEWPANSAVMLRDQFQAPCTR